MAESILFPEKQSRRDFLNYILGIGFAGLAGAVLYPIFDYLEPPKAPEVDVKNLDLGKDDDIPKNSSKMFKVGNTPGILIKTESGELKAYNATCTHLECTVQYKNDEKLIWCACHNGRYDLNGKNISGPPPAPLTPYKVIVQAGEIFIST
ncbi:MAG: Rieske 2Fe-2S domain-containing protein [Ignavibacteria bacterium]